MDSGVARVSSTAWAAGGEPGAHAKRVRIYLREGDVVGGVAAHKALLEFLRDEGAAGATVFFGASGFGASRKVGTTRFLEGLPRRPVVLEWVDEEAQVERLLGRITRLVRGSPITVDPTHWAVRGRSPTGSGGGQHARIRVRCVEDLVAIDAPIVDPSQGAEELLRRVLEVPEGVVVLGRRGGAPSALREIDLLRLPELRAGVCGDLGARASVGDLDLPGAEVLPGRASLEAARKRLEASGAGPMVVARATGHFGILSCESLLRGLLGLDLKPRARSREGCERAHRSSLPLASVATVDRDSGAEDVLWALQASRSDCVAVTDREGTPVGVLTSADLLGAIGNTGWTGWLQFGRTRSTWKQLRGCHRTAGDLVSSPMAVVPGTVRAEELEAVVLGRGQPWVAVVDEGGRLEGIADRLRVLRACVERQGRSKAG